MDAIRAAEMFVGEAFRSLEGNAEHHPDLSVLEDLLSKRIEPAVASGTIPAGFSRDALEYYSRVASQSNRTEAAKAFLEDIFSQKDVQRLLPIECVIWFLSLTLASPTLTIDRVCLLNDLPWDLVQDRVPEYLKAPLGSLHLDLRFAVHEVSEGLKFHPDAYTELRGSLSVLYPMLRTVAFHSRFV